MNLVRNGAIVLKLVDLEFEVWSLIAVETIFIENRDRQPSKLVK